MTHHKIIMMSKKIIYALAHNKTVVREEAEKIMIGEVLVTETDIIYREGQEDGLKKGEEKIDNLYSWLKTQNRTDDILRAVGDKAYQKKLFEEYNSIKH